MERKKHHTLTEVRRARDDEGVAISCEQVEFWLSQSLTQQDGASDAPKAIAAHIADCAECQTEQREMLQLSMARVESTPDPLFVRSVMARVRREPVPVRRQRRTALRFRAAALLAVLLLPISVFLVATIQNDTSETSTIGETETARLESNSIESNTKVKTAAPMSVQLDGFQSGYDRWRVDAQPNGGWIPAYRGDEGSREVVSF
ncbi:MAG: hypothetical protein AAF581_21890 [Planctomycetota bacterium]